MLSNNPNLNVVTYNMGGSQNDYSFVCHHHKIESTEEGYAISQHKTAAVFKDLTSRGQVDVIMLQEVFEKDRPLLKALKSEGFKVLNVTKTKDKAKRPAYINDCAILIRKDRFKDIVNCSQMIDGNDTPIVVATDSRTNQRVMFATGHVPGCSLEENRVDQQDAETGDHYVQGVITKMDQLAEQHHAKVQVFGADMNANPEKLDQNRTPKQQWEHRFRKLENAGFQTHRTRETTEVYPKGNYRQRELDFIFSRDGTRRQQGLLGWLTKKPPLIQAALTSVLLTFGLDADNLPSNASDHRPVMTEFNLKQAQEENN